MTTRFCEVCASEPFKYRCPACELKSCSLECTRTHKIYCAPKAPLIQASTETPGVQPPPSEANGHAAGEEAGASQNGQNLRAEGVRSQVKDLLEQYPSLRDQLRDIYKATLEEQWVETTEHVDRARQSGRGKPPYRNRGPWTREKGFRRGLGKVRKYREQCEDGVETGKCAEGFMRLLALANEEHRSQAPQ